MDEIELAIKRSALEKKLDNYQKTISFLSIANSALGPVNVNFDAETEKEILYAADYKKIYDFGRSWSETYQASALNYGQLLIEKAAEIREYLGKFGRRFSANLVIGNSAYGFKPEFKSLNELAMKLTGAAKKQIRLGAEGKINGHRAIELASKTGSIAYVLHTKAVSDLLFYANERRVDCMVYVLLRISSESRGKASSDLMRIKGNAYFERRGIAVEEISSSLGEYAVFGTGDEVACQVRNLIDCKGASKIALYPVFENSKDLINQIRMLSQVIIDS